MKIKQLFPNLLNQGEVVAHFGKAKLVKRLDYKFELRGGSAEDRLAAREWIPFSCTKPS